MRFEAVTFDCWGTLLVDADWTTTYATRVDCLAASARPFRVVTPEEARAALDSAWRNHYQNWESGHPSGAVEMAREALEIIIGAPARRAREVQEARTIPSPEIQAAASALAIEFTNATLEADIRPVAGSRGLLEALHRRGLRLGMICDTGFATGQTVRTLLDRAGLLEWLTTSIFSDEWGVPKPHPRLFWAALAALEVEPNRAAHIGDLDRTDVRGAKRAGMTAIRLTAHHDDPAAGRDADVVVVDSHEALRDVLLTSVGSEGDQGDGRATESGSRDALITPKASVKESLDAAPPSLVLRDRAVMDRIERLVRGKQGVVIEDGFAAWYAVDGAYSWIPRPWDPKQRMAQHAEVERALRSVLPSLRIGLERVEVDDVFEQTAPQSKSDLEQTALGLAGLRGVLPESENRLDALVKDGRATPEMLGTVAETLIALHREAPHSDAITYRATAEKLASEIRRLGRVLRESEMTTRTFELAEASLLGFVLQHSDLLRSRVAGQRIRQVHGDLRADRIFVSASGEVSILPPLHFAELTAVADPYLDVASLALDLGQHASREVSESFAHAYAEIGLDFEGLGLLDFYRRFCAFRRAAQSAFSLSNISHPASRRMQISALVAAERAGLEASNSTVQPFLVATGGQVGTGKSTVSRMAAEILRAPRIEVDELSAHLIEAPPVEPARHPLDSAGADDAEADTDTTHEADWERIFAEGFREGVYAEVFRQARAVLGSGRSVVLDGCFGKRLFRGEAQRLAQTFGAKFVFLECQLDREIHRERLRQREKTRRASSGTWEELADEFSAAWEPVEELRPSEHVVVDTRESGEENRQRIEEALQPSASES